MRHLVFSLLLVCLSIFIVYSTLAIFVKQDISHPENIVPWSVYQFVSGKPLYPDWREWPHRFMPYGPLLCVPAGVALKLLNIDNYSFSYYLVGRVQSGAYLIGIIGIGAALLVKAGFSRKWALAFFSAYFVLWSGTVVPLLSFRPDFPALFWVLLALYWAYSKPYTIHNTAFTLIFFLLSVAYKPSLWAFPISYTLYLGWKQNLRAASTWVTMTIAVVAVYVAALNSLTNGLFLKNQLGASSLGLTTEFYHIAWDLLTLPQNFPVFTWDWPVRTLFLLLIAIRILITSPNRLHIGIALYYSVSLPINLLMLFKVGAGPNYLLESYITGGLLFGVFVASGWQLPSRNQRILPPLLLLFAIPLLYISWWNLKDIRNAWRLQVPSASQQTLLDLPATALLGDLAFTHPSASSHALSDPVPYTFLVRRGKISLDGFQEKIRTQEFSHIVLSPGTKFLFFYSERLPEAGLVLEKYYEPRQANNDYELWMPKTKNPTHP